MAARLRRGLTVVAVVLLVAVVVVAGLSVWTVRRSFPTLSGTLDVSGLDGEVEVLRDRYGVPHLYADDADDLIRAQGFVHAQDRFWEMDVRRHITAGRLAELFGSDQVDTDVFIRTLGWRRVAEAELALLEDETIRYLEAYAEGVNGYLESRSTSEVSFEYAVLGLQRKGYEPEPWSAADSLAWLKAMAWDLRGNMEDEVARALLATEIGIERTQELYPPFPYDRHPTIVPGGAVTDDAFVASAGTPTLDIPAGALDPLERVAQAAAAVPALLGIAGADGIGSNSWVVSGEHTSTGLPLLANDPHLAPSLPSIWYSMGLHCNDVGPDCPFDLVGFTFSGVPGIIIGHNDRIGWGFTNLGPDVTDLVIEEVDGDRYRVEGEWRDLETMEITLEVAGDDPVTRTIRSSDNGPLVSDASENLQEVGDVAPAERDDGAEYAVALRWTALTPGRTADALFRLNTARDWDDFRAAAELFEVPSQNLVYADVDGNIGYQAPGRIPIRTGYDGRWPVAGWDPATDWDGFIPFDELPSELNPDRGWIVTANQPVVPPEFEHVVTTDTAYGYRAARIVEMVDALVTERSGQIDVADLAAMQGDTASLHARDLVPYLVEAAATVEVPAEAVDLLATWDQRDDLDSAGSALFNATLRHVLTRTFHDELPEENRPIGGSRWFEVVRGLLGDPDNDWWDDTGTSSVERRDDILGMALTDAVGEVTDELGDDPTAWAWGDLHLLFHTHQTLGTSGVGLIEGRFNRGPTRAAGGTSIVNATAWDATEGYEVVWVPSMRMVLDFADLDRSRWIHLTGQSGHAYHPNYLDMADLWARNETIPMRASRQSVEDEATHRLVLQPRTPVTGPEEG